MQPGTLLTATELAERLHLRPSTVLLWARRGDIPVLKITPKVLRFRLDDVVSALTKGITDEE